MNFINLITAFIIISIFLFGFSQILLPSYKLWENAISIYKTAKTIYFISESFKNECKKQKINIENWNRIISTSKELESYTINEIIKDEKLFALRANFIISGEQIEVLGGVSQ